jgi:hypothetical protein
MCANGCGDVVVGATSARVLAEGWGLILLVWNGCIRCIRGDQCAWTMPLEMTQLYLSVCVLVVGQKIFAMSVLRSRGHVLLFRFVVKIKIMQLVTVLFLLRDGGSGFC